MRWLILATGLAISVVAQGAEQQVRAQREVIAAEHRLNDALSRIDAGVIAQIWAEDFQFVFPNGKVSDKSERLAGLGSPGTDTMISTIDDLSVRIYGNAAVAIVKSTWRGTAGGKSFATPYVATHVGIKLGNSWRLTSAQVAQSTSNPQ